MMRVRATCGVFVLAGLAVAGLPAQVPAPVPAGGVARGDWPGPDHLPDRPSLPDVLADEGSVHVTRPDQWTARRAAMARLVEHYAVGSMPPAPPRVTARERESRLLHDGAVRFRLVHLAFGPDEALGFDIAVFTPSAGGPFPTVLHPSFALTPGAAPLPTMARPPEQGTGVDAMTVPTGDQASRAVAGPPRAAPAAMTTPAEPEAAAREHRDLFERGYALVTWHYQDMGEDTIGREADGRWSFRRTRVFPAYPGHDWGLLGAWAWGTSRVVDFVQDQGFADRTRLALIGHSRVGKAVLVAGALDTRIALVAPAGSGAGGTGAYRFNGAARGGREGLDDMLRKYPNWFSPHLYAFRGRVDRLPFDQHWLIALIAPRAFLSLEGTDDRNCEPTALFRAVEGARPAYRLLGAESHLAVHYAPHRHALDAADWAALLDFADRLWRGRSTRREFNRYPSLSR